MSEGPTAGDREEEHFFGAAKVIAALTVLSRVLGMVRDMAIVALGANRATDAFWTAFAVPNLFRRLFGEGALSAAFVPVFTGVAHTQGWDKARLVLANAAGLLAVLLGGLLVLIEIALLGWLALVPHAGDEGLVVQLMAVVMPFMFTVCMLALGSAALNCKGHFAYPAFSPILLNVFMIAAVAVVHWALPRGDRAGLFLLAAAVVVAGAVQLAGVVWLLRSVSLAAMPRLRPVLEPVKRIGKLLLPMMIPLGLVQFSALFDRWYALWMTATPDSATFELFGWTIAKPLQPGVVTCVYVAGRLYHFPLGILGISLATVVFPLMSRYAERGELAGLRNTTNRALRLSVFLGLPAGVGLILLAGPAISLIFRHGDFTSDNAALSASVLQMYCLGMCAYFANHILLRAFFSQKDTTTPLRFSVLFAMVNIVMVVLLVFTPLRAAAIGLATAATSSANALVLIWILRSRWDGIGMGKIFVSALRTVVATAALAVAVLATGHFLAPYGPALAERWGWSWLAPGVVVIPAIAAGTAVFVLAALALRCPELAELRGGKRADDA